MYYRTRSRFSQDDFQYIITTLSGNEREQSSLSRLMSDPESVSQLLHEPRLFERLKQIPPLLISVSPHLFFYLFAYRALYAKGIANDDLADYIADVCTEFRSNDALWQAMGASEGKTVYLVDLLNLMNELDQVQQFHLHRYIGNVTLFLTGFFPDFLFRRTQLKGAPGLAYYEGIGREQYDAAALKASRFEEDAAPVLMMLAERFVAVRMAMNMFTDAYLNLSKARFTIEKIDRQAKLLDDESFRQSLEL